MKINQKTAVITGGASGLGKATAERLHQHGGNIVIADLNEDAGQALVVELKERALFVKTDITRTDEVASMIAQALDKFSAIHFLVNCAGTGFPMRTIGKEAPHDINIFRKIIDINLIGNFDVMRWAAFHMQKNEPDNPEGERGVVINTASAAAFDGQIGQVSYAASKAAIVGMTLPAARDLAICGIRVCTIAPGNFDTPLLQAAPDELKSSLTDQQPFPKRFGKPDEYAMMVQQIIENPMLNGETIRLDGAMRMSPK